MGLKLPRKNSKPSATKAILHLTPGAVLCPDTAKAVTALGYGSGGKEGSPKSPAAWKSKEEGKKEAKSSYIYKKKCVW